jgi:putative oxidoreductase
MSHYISSNGFRIARWAPIPLRLIVGYGFLQHGFAKLVKGPDAFAAILQALGVPAPHFTAWCTIAIEIFGGIAALLGAFIAIASVPMAIVLLVAIFTVHLPNGFSSIKLAAVTASGPRFGPPGYETGLLYLACLAALVIGSAGPFSFDGYLARLKLSRTPPGNSCIAQSNAGFSMGSRSGASLAKRSGCE